MQKISNDKMDLVVGKAAALKAMFVDYDRIKDAAEAELNLLVEQMNDIRIAIHEVLDEAKGDAESYFDERSEKWQESDRGSAYSDWKDKLDQLAGEVEEEFEQPSWESMDEPSWIGEVEDGQFAEPEY